MSETKILKVRTRDGRVEHCQLKVSIAPPWTLSFVGLSMRLSDIAASDLFDGLCMIRKQLETFGAQISCAGARLDVFPSGMSRSMSGGRKAYITRFGAPALQGDLIDIFDPAEPDLVGTVAQQEEYHDKWILSLQR